MTKTDKATTPSPPDVPTQLKELFDRLMLAQWRPRTHALSYGSDAPRLTMRRNAIWTHPTYSHLAITVPRYAHSPLESQLLITQAHHTLDQCKEGAHHTLEKCKEGAR